MNSLQAANAERLLLFSPDTNVEHVADAVKSGRRFYRREKAAVNVYNTVDRTASLIHVSRGELTIGLKLLSFGIQPSAAGRPLENTVVQVCDREFVELCDKFTERVKRGQYKPSQFGNFIHDYLRSNWVGDGFASMGSLYLAH